jgi:hypothetical protein
VGSYPFKAAAGGGSSAKAWQFMPETYGAKGDVKVISDAFIASASHQLTSASAAFTAADVGKTMYVVGAGAAGADLFTTIATFTNATTVQLTATAGTTVTTKGAVYHTDDTAAIAAAYAAAHAYALGSQGLHAQIILSALYGVSTAPTIGGATLGNAIIPLTVVPAASSPKIRIEFAGQGTADASELSHFNQVVPQTSGPGILVTRLDGTNNATNGPSSVIGGPYNGYGAGASLFSNMSLVLSNFRIIAPFNTTYCGVDTLGLAEAFTTGFSTDVLAVPPSVTTWPQKNQASITNQYTFGLRMPDTNNNDRCDMMQYSNEGFCYGFLPSEHTVFDSARTIYCIIGCEVYSGSAMAHGVRGGYLSAELCGFAVGAYNALPFGNSVKVRIAHADTESASLLFDSANLMAGSIGIMQNGAPAYGAYAVTGGTGVNVYELMAPVGPLAAPQAGVASGSPWVNSYNTDVWVTMSATTITAVTITGRSGTAVAQAVPAAATTYAVYVPQGCSYTWTGTGAFTHHVTQVGRT